MDTPVFKSTTEDKPKKKLLNRVRGVIRLKHYSLRSERTYCDWIERFIRFHRIRHPAEMGELEMGGLFLQSAVNALRDVKGFL